MRWPAFARSTHKWIALIVAVQAVFWTLGGVYMTQILPFGDPAVLRLYQGFERSLYPETDPAARIPRESTANLGTVM